MLLVQRVNIVSSVNIYWIISGILSVSISQFPSIYTVHIGFIYTVHSTYMIYIGRRFVCDLSLLTGGGGVGGGGRTKGLCFVAG